MSEAIYGLIGALGGAILGGAATITVPTLTGRRAQRQEQRVRYEAEFDRIMDLRVTTRDVLLILDEARETVRRAEPGDLAGFKEAVLATRTAADRCAVFGLRFEHTPSSRGRRHPAPEGWALWRFLSLSQQLMRLLREDAPNGLGAADPELLRRMDNVFEGVEDSRRMLLGILMDRMEELRAEMKVAGT